MRGAGADEGPRAFGFEGRRAPRLADDTDERAHQIGFDLVHRICSRHEPLDTFRRGRFQIRHISLMRVFDGRIDDFTAIAPLGDILHRRHLDRRERGF